MPALCKLEDVRRVLQKPTGDQAQNDVILQMIDWASRLIWRYTGRQFYKEDAGTKEFAYRGGGLLPLSPFDVRAVTGVTVDGAAITATEYKLRPSPAPDGVYQWLLLGPSHEPRGTTGFDGDRTVAITGSWGFETVPGDVCEACALQVALWMRRDVQAFSATFNLDEGRIERPEALSSSIRASLDLYRAPGIA